VQHIGMFLCFIHMIQGICQIYLFHVTTQNYLNRVLHNEMQENDY
jgi:hypothetical protein